MLLAISIRDSRNRSKYFLHAATCLKSIATNETSGIRGCVREKYRESLISICILESVGNCGMRGIVIVGECAIAERARFVQ